MTLRSDKRGFTLAELAVVVMIVGILSGVALPNLRYAMLKGDAAHIVSDAHTISLAAYAYLGDNGRFPSSSGYGMVPPQMANYLPENYEFGYRGDVTYAWFTFTLPNANNYWQSRNIGLLLINYSTRPDLADPMKAHMGPDKAWGPTMFYFIYAG